jgi:hypothetical protein
MAKAKVASFEEVYAFLRESYLHSRFEGRNGPVWGADYSQAVARSAHQHLEQFGEGFVSVYECRLGRPIKYDANLTILNPDEPPAQIQRRAGHLTHLLDC